MEYDEQHLGLFLLELNRYREKLWLDNNTTTQAHEERTIITFFSLITPTHATSQSLATQMGSQPRHFKGITIDQGIAIYRACRK